MSEVKKRKRIELTATEGWRAMVTTDNLVRDTLSECRALEKGFSKPNCRRYCDFANLCPQLEE